MHRLDKRRQLEEDHSYVKHRFIHYHTRSEEEATRQTAAIRVEIAAFKDEYERLNKLKPQGEAEQLLRGLIIYLSELSN